MSHLTNFDEILWDFLCAPQSFAATITALHAVPAKQLARLWPAGLPRALAAYLAGDTVRNVLAAYLQARQAGAAAPLRHRSAILPPKLPPLPAAVNAELWARELVARQVAEALALMDTVLATHQLTPRNLAEFGQLAAPLARRRGPDGDQPAFARRNGKLFYYALGAAEVNCVEAPAGLLAVLASPNRDGTGDLFPQIRPVLAGDFAGVRLYGHGPFIAWVALWVDFTLRGNLQNVGAHLTGQIWGSNAAAPWNATPVADRPAFLARVFARAQRHPAQPGTAAWANQLRLAICLRNHPAAFATVMPELSAFIRNPEIKPGLVPHTSVDCLDMIDRKLTELAAPHRPA